jgi:alkanesulfonate monooxygenase SsuD/methylene tetrahydromethanopterin reductase-like flavin-dependent oxidoreductase (luciferase family)
VIGGQGEKRTLRVVARFADHWNLPFAKPGRFKAKNEVLLGHCADVGRDPSEITRSVQIALAADQPLEAAAEKAGALFEAGVDLVIFTLRNPYKASRVEPLARALESVA